MRARLLDTCETLGCVIDGAHQLLRRSWHFPEATVKWPVTHQPLKTMVVPMWRPMTRILPEYYEACCAKTYWSGARRVEAFSFEKDDWRLACHINAPACNTDAILSQYKSKYSKDTVISILYVYVSIWTAQQLIKKSHYWQGLLDQLAMFSEFCDILACFSLELLLHYLTV